jgi:hypothetical protein
MSAEGKHHRSAYQTQVEPQPRRVAVRQSLREHHGRARAARQTDHVDDEARLLLLMATAHTRIVGTVIRIVTIICAMPVTPPLHRGQLCANVCLGLVALLTQAGRKQNAHGAEFSATAWSDVQLFS